MAITIDELRRRLDVADLEEQRAVLKSFIESTINHDVLEGIKIANESLSIPHPEFKVISQVRE